MTSSRKYYFIFVIVFISKINGFSQYNKIDRVNTNSYFIYDISQDLNKRLVLSTENGVKIYDGKEIKTFNANSGLISDVCTSHLIDSENAIWVGHYEGGISIIKENKIIQLKPKELKNRPVIKMLQNKEGIIFALTSDQKLFIIRDFKCQQILLDKKINDILIFNNKIIFATNQFIYSLKYDTKLKFKLSILSQNGAQKILSFDNIYLSAFNSENDLNYYIFNGRSLTKIREFKAKTINLNSEIEITSIVQDKNELIISTKNDGIKTISLVYGASDFLDSNLEKYNVGNSIKKLYIDHESSIWVGTFGEDLIKISTSELQQINLDLNIFSISKFKLNKLLIGSQRGVYIYDINSKNIEKTTNFDKVKNFKITALLYEKENIWIGTENNGFYQFNISKNQIIETKFEHKNIKNLNVTSISIDKNSKNIYFSTLEGLFILNKKTQKIQTLDSENGLPQNIINHLFIDSKNRIWLGFKGLGISCFENNEFTTYKEIKNLNSNEINSITEDKLGTIWFGTEGDGIFKFKDKKFSQINTKDGLLSDFVKFITIGSNNQLIIGHKNGITIVKELNSKRYLFKIFRNNSCNENSFLQFSENQTYIGTEKTLDILTFEEKKQINSNTFISSILINNKKFGSNKNIKLPYKLYSVTFEFIRVSFNKQEKPNYKFKLEGFDNQWNYTNSMNEINYPKLEEGIYTFKVYSTNNFGEFDSDPTTITIEIDKPFWKKWWVILLVIITILATIYAIFQWRVKALIKSKLKLEQEVKIKTHELQIEKELVEEKNKDITSSINYAYRIQKAILPNQDLDSFKSINKFIYDKPKDIVSGDFYWEYNHPEFYYFAVADCTGHGVPGAFMSILSSTNLTKIVKENNILLPSEILLNLDKNLIEVLNQYDENAPKDGLEIGILRIQKDMKSMTFSSSKRPLLIKTKDRIQIIKPDIFGIGSFNYGIEKKYHDHHLDLEKGSEYFMYSDGYADQFGGPKNKKITTKKLNELLYSDSNSMEEKYTLLNEYFQNWKKENEQMDDVLVLGIKIIKQFV